MKRILNEFYKRFDPVTRLFTKCPSYCGATTFDIENGVTVLDQYLAAQLFSQKEHTSLLQKFPFLKADTSNIALLLGYPKSHNDKHRIEGSEMFKMQFVFHEEISIRERDNDSDFVSFTKLESFIKEKENELGRNVESTLIDFLKVVPLLVFLGIIDSEKLEDVQDEDIVY